MSRALRILHQLKKRLLIPGLALALALIACAIFLKRSTSPPASAVVTLTFMGFTNAGGEVSALFLVSNRMPIVEFSLFAVTPRGAYGAVHVFKTDQTTDYTSIAVVPLVATNQASQLVLEYVEYPGGLMLMLEDLRARLGLKPRLKHLFLTNQVSLQELNSPR